MFGLMGDNVHLHLELPSRLSEVGHLQKAIVDAAKQFDYDQRVEFALRLAIDEAVTNAIRHGNDNDPSKVVKIEAEFTANLITVTIEDQGSGFDPYDLPDPTLEENIDRPHGRGVMLMNAYMTTVAYNESGNKVTMTKDATCAKPD